VQVPTGRPFDVCQNRHRIIRPGLSMPGSILRISGNKEPLKKVVRYSCICERLRLLPDVHHLAPAGLYKRLFSPHQLAYFDTIARISGNNDAISVRPGSDRFLP
jgi:hypothetical protein